MLVEDVTIVFQELIQNGEDAKASKISFILDERSYGTDSLFPKVEGKEGFARMQGPALYVYNNAIFTEADWKGIYPRVGSKKDNPDKVGKFGMGFSSVYHVTGAITLKLLTEFFTKNTFLKIAHGSCRIGGSESWTSSISISQGMPGIGTSSLRVIVPSGATVLIKWSLGRCVFASIYID